MSTLPLRICDLSTLAESCLQTAAARAAKLNFSHVLWRGNESMPVVAAASALNLSALLQISLSEVGLSDPIVTQHPDWFAIRRSQVGGKLVDPRYRSPADGHAIVCYHAAPGQILEWWDDTLSQHLGNQLQGFLLDRAQLVPPEAWSALIERAKRRAPDATFIVNSIGLTRSEAAALEDCGFDYTVSSLPWWDQTSPWLVEEYDALSRVAPVLACVSTPSRPLPIVAARRRTLLSLGAFCGHGTLAYLDADRAVEDDVREMNVAVVEDPMTATAGALVSRPSTSAAHTVLMRTDRADPRTAQNAQAIVINPENRAAMTEFSETMFGDWVPSNPSPDAIEQLAPGAARIFRLKRASPVFRAPVRDVTEATNTARIVIENVRPSVDGGVFAVKAIVGSDIKVEADILTDGHPKIAAELVFRAEDEHSWHRAEMSKGDNDRWSASLPLRRIGRHRFAIEAWLDIYGSFVHDLAKKSEADRDVTIDIMDGRVLIDRTAANAHGALQKPLAAISAELGATDAEASVAILTAPETVAAMRRAESRSFLTQSNVHFVDSDREGAGFANWYELFPRSQTTDPLCHGTFRDVCRRIPAIRDMGFDVLYFPPIHPIGETNRKGRNNALKSTPEDPGSVYAIGSEAGGHDAVHPELGTLDDFRGLIAAASAHGLEIALDFAVQCSPDHPWLRDHPGWFDWRADGSIKFAENPPKTYEDIVNVDFYARDAVPGLWLALRDIVLFWADLGVRIFRVDNPHTKVFVFWQWLIDDVRARNPDIIFLAEAFTRPKVMYYLAKLGFTQSYTYFTWRNEKAEITEYLKELTTPPVADFFRPHFFANTPDINPIFLQQSGRPGFLIRAALAATLSGLWGIYSGFELCESDPLPGREEYMDSEKYAVKPRDWTAPGNIIAEITALNRVRKSEPALHSHLGVTFYNAANPNILWFGKHTPGSATRILVAINLNPHGAEGADIEIPLWEWDLPHDASIAVEDMLNDSRFVLHGKIQRIHLTPDLPYRIWRLSPAVES